MSAPGRLAAWRSGWLLALRIARRDAARARARSALVLVMIALPVTAIVCAVTLLRTQDVSSTEGLDRRIGGAQALVSVNLPAGAQVQAPDPDDASISYGEELPADRTVDAAMIRRVVPGARVQEVRRASSAVRTPQGAVAVELLGAPFDTPAARGLVLLRAGRLPAARCEVTVTPRLAADAGLGVGDDLVLASRQRCPSLAIVGIADDAGTRDRLMAAGLAPTFTAAPGSRSWLVDGPAVTWSQVRALNAAGALVVSREVVAHPPTLPPQVQAYADQIDTTLLTVLALLATMILIQVVLLAGPAFAVGARRQARDLALVATAGGTPAQARRVVLATAVVLGATAAVVGSGLGIAAARLLTGPLQDRSSSWLGPFQVPADQVAIVAGLGLLSALLAAAVPAFLASRQDVVAVLAGRPADATPSRRSPVAGLVLMGLGIGGAVLGARGAGGELPIAASAILMVLGMVLLVPVLVVAVARLAARLPLPLRYAARDAARHRIRTASAVAAVAATVAGVTALGIGATSDEEQSRATYVETLPLGEGRISSPVALSAAQWDRLRAAVDAADPTARITVERGIRPAQDPDTTLQVDLDGNLPIEPYVTGEGEAPVRVVERAPADLRLSETERRGIDAVLARGRMALLTQEPIRSGPVTLTLTDLDAATYEQRGAARTARVPATGVVADGPTDRSLHAVAFAPPGLLEQHGLSTAVTALSWRTADGSLPTRAAQDRVTGAAADVDASTSVYVERGYQTPDDVARVRLVLIGLGAVLMLGGTLTATLLALADAGADLATLGAVGATPRLRRLVAGAYALLLAGLGAILGLGVGLVPGIAVTYPLTRDFGGGQAAAHYLDIPWGLLAVVVLGLPVLTAAAAAALTRARLPLTRRS